MAHSLPSPVTRGRRYSKHQISASVTLIPKSAHSFDDTITPSHVDHELLLLSCAMQRQDSGYESLASGTSKSPADAPRRRKSSASSSQQTRPPAVARPTRSSTGGSRPLHGSRASTQSLYLTRSQQQPLPTTLFQFPTPDVQAEEPANTPPPPPLPPPTTHYWTSDRTRRLEYAAIDAARHGLKGWVKRNLVPNCMVPKDGGHLDFDDDSGSVRRYRLDLDEGEDSEGLHRSKKGWRSWAKKA